MEKRINQMEPWIAAEEKAAINEYLDAGGWLTEFKKTVEFEQMLAEYIGCKHAIVVANGTVSLTVALMAAGIGAGDEVIVPDLTMLASATSVLLAGATPVFIDVAAHDLCLDLDQLDAAIGPRTKAVMLVSLNGRSPDMQRAVDICKRRGVMLVEDAAQSLGSRHAGKHLGTWGEIGSFSFSAPKVITTGQGGCVTTDDDELAARSRKIKDFGRRQAGVDFHEVVGYNFKFTDLQAVVGIAQMKKLSWRVQRKKEMFACYRELLADIERVRFLETDIDAVSPWFIDIYVSERDALRAHLETQNIGSRPIYPALHSQPAFGRGGEFPVTNKAAAEGLWLPSSSFLTDDDIARVCGEIKRFYA
jgi:perosamine synthetase